MDSDRRCWQKLSQKLNFGTAWQQNWAGGRAFIITFRDGSRGSGFGFIFPTDPRERQLQQQKNSTPPHPTRPRRFRISDGRSRLSNGRSRLSNGRSQLLGVPMAWRRRRQAMAECRLAPIRWRGPPHRGPQDRAYTPGQTRVVTQNYDLSAEDVTALPRQTVR